MASRIFPVTAVRTRRPGSTANIDNTDAAVNGWRATTKRIPTRWSCAAASICAPMMLRKSSAHSDNSGLVASHSHDSPAKRPTTCYLTSVICCDAVRCAVSGSNATSSVWRIRNRSAAKRPSPEHAGLATAARNSTGSTQACSTTGAGQCTFITAAHRTRNDSSDSASGVVHGRIGRTW